MNGQYQQSVDVLNNDNKWVPCISKIHEISLNYQHLLLSDIKDSYTVAHANDPNHPAVTSPN